jgi:hypothetical protein
MPKQLVSYMASTQEKTENTYWSSPDLPPSVLAHQQIRVTRAVDATNC